jgi:hypothetical protein
VLHNLTSIYRFYIHEVLGIVKVDGCALLARFFKDKSKKIKNVADKY